MKLHLIVSFFLLQIIGSKKLSGQFINYNGINKTADSTRPPLVNNNYFKTPAIVLPAGLLIYGILKPVPFIKNADIKLWDQVKNNYPNFRTSADDYLMWAPSSAVYLLDALSIKTTHSFKEHLLLDAGSIVIAGGIGFVMRKIFGSIKIYKVNGANFPSGHTVNVFRGAEILHQEIKGANKIWSYSGYLASMAVGTLRIYNKQHYLTEVLAGAGLGMLSTKLTYWVSDKIKQVKKKRTAQ